MVETGRSGGDSEHMMEERLGQSSKARELAMLGAART